MIRVMLCAAALLNPAIAGAQKPGHDEREIAPTPAVTPIETPSSRTTPATRGSRGSPGVTRTPTPERSGAARHRRNRYGDSPAIIAGHGSGKPLPPGARRAAPGARRSDELLEPLDVATWVLFGVLVVALGFVTIRMLRLTRLRPIWLEPVDAEDLLRH